MYAIISLQGKQYRVEEGQRLFVDRIAHPAGKPFHPVVLFVGGDGKAEFSPKGTQVTARVVQDVLGEKIRIGKYKPKTGYRRHTGHRSKLTEVEITGIGVKAARQGTGAAAKSDKPKPTARPKAETKATPSARTRARRQPAKPSPAEEDA
jgi:large subunit ribosomal protein L21